MKKITFFITKLGHGGAERVATVLANYCVSLKDVQIDAVITYDTESTYKLDEGITIYTLPYSKLSVLRKIRRMFEINSVLKKIEPDVVVSIPQGANAYIAISKLINHSKYKIIFSQRSDPSCEYTTMFKQFFGYSVFKTADIIVFQTEEAANFFPNYLKKKGEIILNPISEDLPSHNIDDENCDIVTFCRIEKVKNLQLLIRAFSKVHKIYPFLNLRVWGKGSQEDNLRKLIEELEMDNSIFLEGHTDRVHEMIKNAMIYVNSSDHEGVSNAMLESMCIGLPVICTDCPVGGARSIIDDHENGILVPVNDENGMISAILGLVENRDLREKLSSNAKKLKKKIAYPEIIKQWMNVIQQ